MFCEGTLVIYTKNDKAILLLEDMVEGDSVFMMDEILDLYDVESIDEDESESTIQSCEKKNDYFVFSIFGAEWVPMIKKLIELPDLNVWAEYVTDYEIYLLASYDSKKSEKYYIFSSSLEDSNTQEGIKTFKSLLPDSIKGCF